MRVPQELYAAAATESRMRMRKAMLDPKTAALLKKARSISLAEWAQYPNPGDHPVAKAAARALIKAGVTTSLGFNFFDLRGPAYFIFPLLTPFIQMIGKQGKVNAGVGTAAHWKATRNPNATYNYVGVQEGQRGPISTPDENDYLATYKELGMDGGETFTAQFAGEGYTDNLADEHFRNLARLRLAEEMMTLGGNSGTAAGNLGFALGKMPTPTGTLKISAGFGSGTCVAVAVVGITWMGVNPGGQAGYAKPPSVANGITTNYTRTNADGSQTNVACGVSAISNVSAQSVTNSTAGAVSFSIPAQKGAVAYGWFVGINVTAALGNLSLAAITSYPGVTINVAPTGTQLANAAGLSTDNSFQPTDFDGLATYSFLNGTWTDMNNGTFTPDGNGQVTEIESDLSTLWTLYQAQPDAIWCSADVRQSLEQAIIFSSTGTNSYIFPYDRAGQDSGLMGGFIVSAYKSKYSISPTGGVAIPIRIHPQFPPGTLLYDINTNPYPHSRVPAVRTFLLQRDYYAIEWPVTTRQWTFGTYIHEVLAHYMPWITAIRTGVGPFVAPACYLAALAFGEDFFTGARVNLVRKWLYNDFAKRGPLQETLLALYQKYGKRVAAVVEKNSLLKAINKRLFGSLLAKAEAKYGA